MKRILLTTILLFSCVSCVDNPIENETNCRGHDLDGDAIPVTCDNCEDVANPDQSDIDFDGLGDACDSDRDGDRIVNEDDNCPDVFDVLQYDVDEDGIGDVCDDCASGERDSDDDGIFDCVDTCPDDADDTNLDSDGDGIGDVCDVCPQIPDRGQNTTDGAGDRCNDRPFGLSEMTIAELHLALEQKQVTCVDVAKQTLSRIRTYDLSVAEGAARNAFVTLNASIEAQAAELDERQKNEGLLPLHCVPFVVKTNFEAPEVETTGGTHALVGTFSSTNSPSVQRLRDAGALLVASTTMDELARKVAGVSSRSGKTGNAYDPLLASGGSSAGSGTAVGSSFAAVGLGTDNCSSLLLPAAFNGLASIRSTHLLIEMNGMFPSGLANGVAGPMTRSVTDLAQVMDHMVAQNRPTSVDRTTWRRPTLYSDHLLENGLDGKRVGILRELRRDGETRHARPFETTRVSKTQTWHQLFELIESSGGEVVENVRLPGLDLQRRGGGFVHEMVQWFERVKPPVKNYEELCATETYSRHIWEDKTDCLLAWETGLMANSVKTAFNSRDRYYKNAFYVEQVMDDYDLDVLLYPTTPSGEAGTRVGRENCLLSSISGLPTMTVPVSYNPSNRRPFGITLTARNWDEAALFEVAYAMESRIQARPKPDLPNVPMRDIDVDVENELRIEIGNNATAFLRENGRDAFSASVMTTMLKPILMTYGYDDLLE